MARCILGKAASWAPRLAIAAGLLNFSALAGFSQVVQLPSYRTFSYSGSAWVPDAGTTSLGGNRSSMSSQVSRGWGPYSGRASGSSLGGRSLSVSVDVIDLQAMDDAILSANVAIPKGGTGITSSSNPLAAGRRSVITGMGATVPKMDKRVDLDPGRWQRVLAGAPAESTGIPSLVESNIRYYLRQGNEAERQGRIIASRVYYRMALEAMTPDMLVRYQTILDEREEAAEKAAASAADPDATRRSF